MDELLILKEKLERHRDIWDDCLEFRKRDDLHFETRIDTLNVVLAIIEEMINESQATPE